MTAKRSLSMLMLVAAAAAGACTNPTGPDVADANGRWEGTLTHPAYDGGALSLSLVDANGAVSGSYRLILSRRVNGRALVEQSGGNVTGSSTGGRLTLSLARSRGDAWLLEGRLDGSHANGEWSTSTRITGTFDVSR